MNNNHLTLGLLPANHHVPPNTDLMRLLTYTSAPLQPSQVLPEEGHHDHGGADNQTGLKPREVRGASVWIRGTV